MKDSPSSEAGPPVEQVPIVPPHPEQAGDSLLPSPEATTGNPLETSALSKVSASTTSGNILEENKRLKEEVAECRRSLEEWTRAEAGWSGQRRLFKVIAETVTDVIVLTDRQGNRTWTNPACTHLLGYGPEELAGTFALTEVHPEDKYHAAQALTAVIEQGVTRQAEFRVRQKDGAWLRLLTETIPLTGPDDRVETVVLIGHDISGKRQAEEAPAPASTRVTAAEMAEDMARDFDRALTDAADHLALAKNLNNPANAVAVRLNEVGRALQQARDLIGRRFAPGSPSGPPRVAFEPVVQKAVAEVINGTLVRAEYNFNWKLPEIEVDADAFAHAIRNLVTNCVQAMDKGVVRLSADCLGREQFKNNPGIPLKPGHYVRLRIQDQGHGIPEKILPRVFEPRFTTRQGSQGLGLTTALSAIQRMGGTITLDSTPGVGTTACVYLPAAHPVSAAGPATAGATAPPGLSEKKRILLMDDEQMILDIVSRMLTHLGYEVKTCPDGSQAIAAFAKAKANAQTFDVVLMDLFIPNGVGGQDAVHTIIQIDPAAKVIASSGHLDHPVMLDHKRHGFAAVLEKPYKLEKLQQVIEAVIGASAPAQTATA